MQKKSSRKNRVVELLSADAVVAAERARDTSVRLVQRAERELEKLRKLEREARRALKQAGGARRAPKRLRQRAEGRTRLRRKHEQRLKEARAELRARKQAIARAEAHERSKKRAVTAFLREWERTEKRAERNGMSVDELVHSGPLFGAQIRTARTLLGRDQRKFAALIGVSPGALRSMERVDGELELDSDQRQAIRERLGRAGVELIGRGFYAGTGGAGARLKPAGGSASGTRPPGGRRTSARRTRRSRLQVA